MDLKSVNWKRHGNTVVKVLMDTKVLGMLVLMGFTIYGIGWDTVMKPSLDAMRIRDEAIAQQREEFNKRKELKNQFGIWDQQLKGLDVKMIPVLAGNSAKVISVSESAEILSLAKGEKRSLPPLQPPHDKRSGVSISLSGSQTMDLIAEDGAAIGANMAAGPGGGGEHGGPGGPGGHGEGGMGAAPTTLPVERYDFELKVSATYPALVDLLNELVTQKNLIKINKVTISKPQGVEEPDPETYPDFGLKLDMVVSLSIFLYADNAIPNP